RLGKVSTAPDLLLHGPDDGRVGVPGQRGAVAAVQVDVGVPVHVVDLRALAVAQPDRLRRGDLPAGGDAAGQRALSGSGQPGRSGLAADEDGLLLGDDAGQLVVLTRILARLLIGGDRCFDALVGRHGAFSSV